MSKYTRTTVAGIIIIVLVGGIGLAEGIQIGIALAHCQ